MNQKLIFLQVPLLVITLVQLSVIQLCSGNFGPSLKDARIDILDKVLGSIPVSGNKISYELLKGITQPIINSRAFDTVGQFKTIIASILGPIAVPYALDFDLPSNRNNTYDYVIVGAGSAGSTLAARLSEDPNVKVLVIEAGGQENKFNNVPIFATITQKTKIDWQYFSTTQERSAFGLNDGQIAQPRGKCAGGSSSLNFMIYCRGNKLDYDIWEEEGATGWNHSAMVPYFIKMEGNTDPLSQPGYHGTTGPITISTVEEPLPVDSAFLQGCREYGLNIGDYNGNDQKRFRYTPFTIREGERCSTGRAYLSPASFRPNLHILFFSRAYKIIFEGKRAVGVAFSNSYQDYQAFASKKVIISTGGIATPQLLMLSGIGPKDELDKFNIPIVHESPGVGKNMQDHPFTFLLFTTRDKTSLVLERDLIDNFLIYEATHKGKFVTPGSNIVGFYRSSYARDSRPDIQVIEFAYVFGGVFPDFYLGYLFNFNRQTYYNYFLPNTGSDGTMYALTLVRPTNRGEITLASSNYRDNPKINFRFFQNITDLKAMAEGCRLLLNITKTPAMQNVRPRRFSSPLGDCDRYPFDSEPYLICLVQTLTFTLWHTVGTAKMGSPNDPMAVVSPDLHVYGVENLMVVDASVFPQIPTGNTNTPTIVVAERIADILKGVVLRAKTLPFDDEEEVLNDYIRI